MIFHLNVQDDNEDV